LKANLPFFTFLECFYSLGVEQMGESAAMIRVGRDSGLSGYPEKNSGNPDLNPENSRSIPSDLLFYILNPERSRDPESRNFPIPDPDQL
jgi:hypothetical protein